MLPKEELLKQIESKFTQIYGKTEAPDYTKQMEKLIDSWEVMDWQLPVPLSESNIYMITYGDSIYEDNKPTLQTLQGFVNEQLEDIITDVHLLPMFPYTSDDGFSVTDHREIDTDLGSWDDIENFAKDKRLMFDFVANHMSQSSNWFNNYLAEKPGFEQFFIPKDKTFDTSRVVRPRTSPLFHNYAGKKGAKTAWTTFSEDQVDVNVRHFPALKELTDILLMYANRGGTSIRLDAIGFLWKQSGTTCMHLPETHVIIQLWRDLLDYFRPGTQIITETNVPHKENVSYLGDGTNEAHMVYQFPLPPLVLYSFTEKNATKLTNWAKTINKVSDKATYFNFLASHDGIGMRPTEGILTTEDQQSLIRKVENNGGRISYKTNPDGTESVYELNINYADALVNRNEGEGLPELIQKMIAAHSILLSFIGVPAIYYHSLLGSGNDYHGLEESGINRRINRKKLHIDDITKELQNDNRRNKIFGGLASMVRKRQQESAFSPFAEQEVLDLSSAVFALDRHNLDTGERIRSVTNVTNETVTINIDMAGIDLLSEKPVNKTITLEPYGTAWVK